MPRTIDPTRLSDEEAKSFRQFVRDVRDAKGLTNEVIAKQLGWEIDRFLNCMKIGRPLLSAPAHAIYKAIVRDLRPRAASNVTLPFVTNRPVWLRVYEGLSVQPPALIPEYYIPAFVERIVDELSRAPQVGKSTLREVEKTLNRVLHRDGPAMAKSWYEQTVSIIQRQIIDTESSGELIGASHSFSELKDQPSIFSREVVWLAASLAYPRRR